MDHFKNMVCLNFSQGGKHLQEAIGIGEGREFCNFDSYISESLAEHLIRRRETFTGDRDRGRGAVASDTRNFDLVQRGNLHTTQPFEF